MRNTASRGYGRSREVAVGHAHQDLIPAARRRSRKAMLP